MRESELNRSRVSSCSSPKSGCLGLKTGIFGHLSPMCVFGGFFVAYVSFEGAFSLPYANGHARKSM